jgi:hypothetical protein
MIARKALLTALAVVAVAAAAYWFFDSAQMELGMQ